MNMSLNKMIDARITSIFSPICQTMIHENMQESSRQERDNRLNSCTELLIIRLNGTVIGYAIFDVLDNVNMIIRSLHFRSLIKDHTLGEYWLSRQLNRHLRNNTYHNFLLAS